MTSKANGIDRDGAAKSTVLVVGATGSIGHRVLLQGDARQAFSAVEVPNHPPP